MHLQKAGMRGGESRQSAAFSVTLALQLWKGYTELSVANVLTQHRLYNTFYICFCAYFPPCNGILYNYVFF